MFGRMGWGGPVAMRVLEQVLLHPRDDVARLVEWFAVDEQAGNLAFSADGDKCLFGIGIGRDVAGMVTPLSARKRLTFMQYGQPVITYSASS